MERRFRKAKAAVTKKGRAGLKCVERLGTDRYPPETIANIQLMPVIITSIEKFFARVFSSGDRSAMDAKQILKFPEKKPVMSRIRIKRI